MDAEGGYEVEDEEHFWHELFKIVNAPCETHKDIDDILRSYLAFTSQFKEEYLVSEYEIARCSYQLLESALYKTNQDYVRRQMLFCLLQEDESATLHVTAAFLLFDGRSHEPTFEMMQMEGAFPKLVELIRDKHEDESGLHRLLLELLYEMSRMQRLTREDLVVVDDAFVLYLFQLIEQLSNDAEDPYHYHIIRVLLVLNEQYMCLANAPTSPDGEQAMTNRIVKLLSAYGPSYRTFGENLILLLNRESALSAQLLILKLLYLLFTTPSTYEYFYTNDLHVLVDVIIRNLLDLDAGNGGGIADDGAERDGQRALRHTYLRVLCPLLRNTQLARIGNNYKRDEVRKMLYLLVNRSSAHFAPVDETVIRLVIRCKQIEWLREEGDEQDEEIERKLSEVAPKQSEVAKKMLGMSLDEGGVSQLSVVDVSANVAKEKEKPSVPAPRRNRKKKNTIDSLGSETNGGEEAAAAANTPEVPAPRRMGRKKGTGDTLGSQTNGGEEKEKLKPPPVNVPTIIEPDADEGGHSPFADDNVES